MANTKPIKWLRNILGNKFFPVTHMKAVRDDDGNTLSSALTNINEQISTKQDTLKNDLGDAVNTIVTSSDPTGAAAHGVAAQIIPSLDYLVTELNKKLTKLTSSTDNAVVRFDGTTGNIQNSGVTINDSNQVTAAKFITSGGSSSQFVKGDGSVDSNTYTPQTSAGANSLLSSLPGWTAIPTDTTKLVRRDTGGSASFGQVTFLTVWNYINGKAATTYAPLASPTLTGTPTAPTATTGTNTTQIATTAFVQNAVNSLPTKYWANLQVGTAANYITEPEIKSLKINGSSTNAASTQNAVIQYDTTNKCIKFVFN